MLTSPLTDALRAPATAAGPPARSARCAAAGGPREGGAAPPPAARVQARPVAEHLEAADAEADRHVHRAVGGLERPEAPHQERVERHVPVVVGREPRDALDDPGRLPERLQIFPQAAERAPDVEVVDPEQGAPARVEEDQLAEREKLESAAEPRARPPRRR